MQTTNDYNADGRHRVNAIQQGLLRTSGSHDRDIAERQMAGWEKSCDCPGTDSVPATVYDPFTGVASTAIAALDLGRRFVGTEINSDYVQQAHERIAERREVQARVRQAS